MCSRCCRERVDRELPDRHATVCATFNDLNFGGAMDDGTRRLRAAGGELATFFGQSSFATYAIVHEHNAVPVDAEVDLALLEQHFEF